MWRSYPSRAVWLAAAAVVVATTNVGPADSAPRSSICRSLSAQLSRAGSSSGISAKYDAAIQRQRGELAKGRAQLRAAGCGFFSGNANSCGRLRTGVSRMESNLASLQQTRARMGGAASSRASILAALDASNCRGGGPGIQKVIASDQTPQPSLFEKLFGQPKRNKLPVTANALVNTGRDSSFVTLPARKQPRDPDPDVGVDRVAPGGWPTAIGTVRTYCVRTCDGYYFPMSPASTRSDYARDAHNCQAACPGTEMQLYYFKDSDEDAAGMLSVKTGQPYAAMSKAFAYRDVASIPQCSCGRVPRFATAHVSTPEQPAYPIPENRPDLPPYTEAKQDAQNDAADPEMRSMLSDVDGTDAAHRKVRVVGPTYFPDQSAATGSPAPAQTEVR